MGTTPAERAVFSFEHAMAHRTLLGAMSPIAKFSLLPYQLDPQRLDNSKYLLDHQQAHNDANSTALDINSTNNLIDTTGNMRWWTFANHLEHFQMFNNLPETLGPYPFW
jgi:hypothetical protein